MILSNKKVSIKSIKSIKTYEIEYYGKIIDECDPIDKELVSKLAKIFAGTRK